MHPILPSLASLILSAALLTNASAALSLSALHTPTAASFAGFTAPGVWATATPTDGQLDSDRWSMNIDGPLATTPATFGTDQTGGLGSSTGSESSTGVYAFEVGAAEPALGIQATGTFWTPGMFTLRLQNTTGGPVTALQVEWTTWVFNDQGRSNSFQFLHSPDNTAYTQAGSEFTVVSPELADSAPVAWQAHPQSVEITGLNLADGEYYHLRWGGDDVSGSGSRDELALGGVQVTPVPEPSIPGLLALALLARIRRRR